MIFDQFIRANSYPVGKNKSFSTTEFIIKWFCLSMNPWICCINRCRSLRKMRKRSSPLWGPKGEIESSKSDNFLRSEMKKSCNLCLTGVDWRTLSLGKKLAKCYLTQKWNVHILVFPRLFILPCSWRSCPGFAMALAPCLAFDLELQLLK